MTPVSHIPSRATWPLILMAILFFVIGFVTWANGPLITFVQVVFQMSDFRAFLVPAAFYLSYVVFSIPSSWITHSYGMKRGMVFALCIMALGIVTFARFITWQMYNPALVGLFILGAGLALLQVTINPYVSLLGSPERAAQRIAFMGICNKFAGILAPLVLGALVMRDIDHISIQLTGVLSPEKRDALITSFTHGLFIPYIGIASLLLITAALVGFSSLPEPPSAPKKKPALSFISPRIFLGAVALFLYVGIEVMAGDAIGTYGHNFGLPLTYTKFFTSATLTAMLCGYGFGIFISPKFIPQERYLAFSCAIGVILALIASLTTGYISVGCIALLGFTNAMIWPTLFPLAIKDAGSATAFASSILIMAICGGAILPQLWIALSHIINFQIAFSIFAIGSYSFISSYVLFWHHHDTQNLLTIKKAPL